MRCTLLTLVALSACQDKKPAPPALPPPPHDGVTLIQPGAAPFQTVRYHLSRGSRTTSELIYDFAATTDGQRTAVPTLVVELDTVVTDVLADGTAQLRITIARTGVREQVGSSVGSDLIRVEAAAMQGVIITGALTPDGKLSDSHIDAANLPDNVRTRLESLTRSLEQAAMQLPAEPVGIGATWRERKRLPAGGISALSETTFTLTSVTRDRITYSGAGIATGAAQTIEQDGAKVEVTNTRGHSETEGTIDLTRYAPQVTTSSTFTTAMNVVAPDQAPGTGPSTVEITMAIQLAPTYAEASSSSSESAPADAGSTGSDTGPTPPDAGSAPSDAGAERSAQGAHSAP